jgi:hypothetical protein
MYCYAEDGDKGLWMPLREEGGAAKAQPAPTGCLKLSAIHERR